MSGHEAPGWKDQMTGGAIGFLSTMIALYLGIAILQEIWPWLLGMAGVIGITWAAIVVYRTWRDRW